MLWKTALDQAMMPPSHAADHELTPSIAMAKAVLGFAAACVFLVGLLVQTSYGDYPVGLQVAAGMVGALCGLAAHIAYSRYIHEPAAKH